MQVESGPSVTVVGASLRGLLRSSAWLSTLMAGGAKAMIHGYRRFLSPLLTPSCRFSPSCSGYALGCLDHHPPLMAFQLILKRILRCHPWGGQGWDPVPERAGDGSKAGEAAHLPGLCSDLDRCVIPCGSPVKGEFERAQGAALGKSPALGPDNSLVGPRRSWGRNEQR